ncbi:MAG: hypothetical protein ACI81T_004073 [Bacteroidia bacterium]|jgi:hypothetical protein
MELDSKPIGRMEGVTAASVKASVLLVVAQDDEMEGASDVIAKAGCGKVRPAKQIELLDGGHFWYA